MSAEPPSPALRSQQRASFIARGEEDRRDTSSSSRRVSSTRRKRRKQPTTFQIVNESSHLLGELFIRRPRAQRIAVAASAGRGGYPSSLASAGVS